MVLGFWGLGFGVYYIAFSVGFLGYWGLGFGVYYIGFSVGF